jgi:hypothetical protein
VSVRLIADVLDSALPTTQRFVALVLANYADDEGENAWPSVKTIADKTGYSASTVRTSLRGLEELGVLEQAAPANTLRRPTTYRVVASQLPHREPLSSGRPHRQLAPRAPAGGGQGTGSRRGTPPGAGAEPSVEPSPIRQSSVAIAPRSRPTDLIFDGLYEIALGKPYVSGEPDGLTVAARSALNTAVRDLKAAGATPELLADVPAAWQLLFAGPNPPTCTPSAIAKWWPQLVAVIERGYIARGSGDESGLRRKAAAEADAAALERIRAEALEEAAR